MIHVWIILVALFAINAHAEDFSYIKLSPKFKQYLSKPKPKSVPKKALQLVKKPTVVTTQKPKVITPQPTPAVEPTKPITTPIVKAQKPWPKADNSSESKKEDVPYEPSIETNFDDETDSHSIEKYRPMVMKNFQKGAVLDSSLPEDAPESEPAIQAPSSDSSSETDSTQASSSSASSSSPTTSSSASSSAIGFAGYPGGYAQAPSNTAAQTTPAAAAVATKTARAAVVKPTTTTTTSSSNPVTVVDSIVKDPVATSPVDVSPESPATPEEGPEIEPSTNAPPSGQVIADAPEDLPSQPVEEIPSEDPLASSPEETPASTPETSDDPLLAGSDTEFNQQIRTDFLGGSGTTFTSPFGTDGEEESPLYTEIRAHLESAHKEIGLREVTQMDILNRQFNMGTENFSGFSWQKPFGVVHVHADRQVTPNLFGANWLVTDTFTFDIEATTFLERASESGLVDMSKAQIGAFAGITFQRVYTSYHYANSFADGLKADFSKLFLPFLRFNSNAISKMTNEEIIKREDNWTARVGGLITTPPVYMMSLTAGVLAQFAYQQMVSVQSADVQDNTAEKVRLTVKSAKGASVTANMSLQLDFFKLLKLTLMNFDLTYEYASAKEFTLGMNAPDWQHVVGDETQGTELKQILKGYGHVQNLEPYVVTLEESESSSFATRASLLIWGRMKKTKTEQIRVIKDQVVRVFFKSYSQSMRVVQNLFSRLFSAIVYKILKLPMGVKNTAIFNREITMEYEATNPQAGDPNISRVDSSEQFSFVLNASYEAAKTTRLIDKRFKNDVIWFLDSFTTLSKDYMTLVKNEQLRGPILIESNLRVEKDGFNYLVAQPEDDVFGHVAKVCGSNRVDQWKDAGKRAKFLSHLQIGKEACVKTIGKDFVSFITDYKENHLKPSLAKFKNFISKYYKQTESITDLYVLFGESNTFVHGQFNGTTNLGTEHVASFSSGQFRGLGVIDNFKRADGSRMPASIVGE